MRHVFLRFYKQTNKQTGGFLPLQIVLFRSFQTKKLTPGLSSSRVDVWSFAPKTNTPPSTVLCFVVQNKRTRISVVSRRHETNPTTSPLVLCKSDELELTNTNPNGTEANASGRSGNARALRKQSKCGMIQEGEGHWPNSSENLQKARNLWVLRTPQNNK